mmetsp:Transcript_72007/g.119891  ORF Transcript_72007/g.119891 Transcript_72007/m.119891 type:complete len:211 (+) Transcript_72007:703-1335(+)
MSTADSLAREKRKSTLAPPTPFTCRGSSSQSTISVSATPFVPSMRLSLTESCPFSLVCQYCAPHSREPHANGSNPFVPKRTLCIFAYPFDEVGLALPSVDTFLSDAIVSGVEGGAADVSSGIRGLERGAADNFSCWQQILLAVFCFTWSVDIVSGVELDADFVPLDLVGVVVVSGAVGASGDCTIPMATSSATMASFLPFAFTPCFFASA